MISFLSMWARTARIILRDLPGYNENAIVTAEVSISDGFHGTEYNVGELEGDHERLSRNGHSDRQSTDSGLVTGRGREPFEARRIVVEIAQG
jgi:hypothetical protein